MPEVMNILNDGIVAVRHLKESFSPSVIDCVSPVLWLTWINYFDFRFLPYRLGVMTEFDVMRLVANTTSRHTHQDFLTGWSGFSSYCVSCVPPEGDPFIVLRFASDVVTNQINSLYILWINI